MANILPPPPVNDQPGSFTWLEWYRQLRTYVSTTGSVPWYIINFAGSNITDIASREHNQLQTLQGGTAGEMYHLTAAQYAALTAGLHNSLAGLQGGTATERYHLTASASTNWVAYLAGGTPGYGWSELLGTPVIQFAGANDPDWSVYRGTIKQYQYKNTAMTEMWFAFHMQHDYKPGSDIYIHVHWSHIVAGSGDAKWYFDVTYAKGHNQAAFIAPITTSVVQTASATPYQHMIAEVQLSSSTPSGSQLDSATLEPDGVILVRMYRDAADVADTLTQRPFVHFVDIHYQTDRMNTKNKAPNFYV